MGRRARRARGGGTRMILCEGCRGAGCRIGGTCRGWVGGLAEGGRGKGVSFSGVGFLSTTGFGIAGRHGGSISALAPG